MRVINDVELLSKNSGFQISNFEQAVMAACGVVSHVDLNRGFRDTEPYQEACFVDCRAAGISHAQISNCCLMPTSLPAMAGFFDTDAKPGMETPSHDPWAVRNHTKRRTDVSIVSYGSSSS